MRDHYDTDLIISAVTRDDFATTVGVVSLKFPYKNFEIEVARTENGPHHI
jgi:hypothetical protein